MPSQLSYQKADERLSGDRDEGQEGTQGGIAKDMKKPVGMMGKCTILSVVMVSWEPTWVKTS